MSIKNRKLQVFVSSTFTDLREERLAAVEAILSTGNIPAGMELFAACDQSQMEVIKEWIQESDVYLLILGGRYGKIEPVSGKSYTQLEYEYALEIEKPHFAVVTSEKSLNAKVKKHGLKVIERDSTEKYNDFREFVSGPNKMVEFWDDSKDIKQAIFKSLSVFTKREELVGWVRGVQVDSTGLPEEMARLEKENFELRQEIGRLQNDFINDLGGSSFQEIFEILERKKYKVVDTEVLKRSKEVGSIPKEVILPIMKGAAFEEVSANDLFAIEGENFNGFTSCNIHKYEGFYLLLQQVGLIEIKEREIPKNEYTFSRSRITNVLKFTQIGRKYFFKLRSLEKYKDWQL